MSAPRGAVPLASERRAAKVRHGQGGRESAQSRGIEVMKGRARLMQPNLDVVFTNRDYLQMQRSWADKNADVVVAMLRAYIEANEFIKAEPAKAAAIAARGVHVRRADFADADSVARAFEGATKVLIVSLPLPTAVAVPQHRVAIDAAVGAGVSRILYTSQMGSDAGSAFPPMRAASRSTRTASSSAASA